MASSTVSPLDHDSVRAFALSLPETSEGRHHGHSDLRVRGKVFVGFTEDAAVNVKTTPERLAALTAADPEAYRDAWGGRWVRVALDSVSAEELLDLVLAAWELSAPAHVVSAYRTGVDR